MKTNAKMMAIGLVLTMVFCYAGTSLAETSIHSDTASVELNFQVTIANYIEFRVGTAGVTTDTINFSPTAAELGANTPITGTGGDAGGSQVNVSLLSNTPQITITADNDTPTGLENGIDRIDWLSITTTDIGGNLAPPLLNNAGGEVSPDTPLAGPQTLSTTWEYQYTRRVGDPIPSIPGTYNGTVTYTATSL